MNSFIISLVFLTTVLAQDIPRLDGELQPVFLVICDSSPSKIIVLDDTGKWLHRVRDTEIKIDGSTPIIKCTLYEGHYRPTSPEIKVWRLNQIKTVSETEFQNMINKLQSDPEAVKKILMQPVPAAN
jgi:hypothetical protein